ncbi:hypothetical protein BJX63DRAFT_3611 [Aspergillus granulosus]|uniref:Uncharacterized protein n=1 Tax=Aspergillus granulosus TaxID=176169 RepID=A0ABR4I5J0_9EURO
MVPNWLRIILLVLTFISFLPQLHLIWRRREASGISLSYVLFNLVAATEQFALNYGFINLTTANDGIFFAHDPPTFGDWLNLAQTLLFLVLCLVYLALCLCFPSESNSTQKRFILRIYIAYVLFAIIPLFICAIFRLDDTNNTAWYDFPVVLTFNPHILWMNYIGTILATVAMYLQAKVILRPDPSEKSSLVASQLGTPHGSLSLFGLAIQCVLFIVLAISWIFRVVFPLPLLDSASWRDFDVLKVWYELVGSIAVDNAVFGIGQGILLFLAMRREKRDGKYGVRAGLSAEKEPLLQEDRVAS